MCICSCLWIFVFNINLRVHGLATNFSLPITCGIPTTAPWPTIVLWPLFCAFLSTHPFFIGAYDQTHKFYQVKNGKYQKWWTFTDTRTLLHGNYSYPKLYARKSIGCLKYPVFFGWTHCVSSVLWYLLHIDILLE